MGEYLFNNNADPVVQRQLDAAEEILQAEQRHIRVVYGAGFDFEAGQARPGKGHHNELHAVSTAEDTDRLTEALELPLLFRVTGHGAGILHDAIYTGNRGRDEEESAELLRRRWHDAGFSEPYGRVGALAIIGTTPTIKNGVLVSQKATELEYPSKEAEQVALSAASGDLGRLFTPEGVVLAFQLVRELFGDNPTPEQLRSFYESQVALVESYRYPLPQAERILATHRSEVIAYTHKVHNQLEQGTINPEELPTQHLKFYRDHR